MNDPTIYLPDAQAVFGEMAGYFNRLQIPASFGQANLTVSPLGEAWMVVGLDVRRVRQLAPFREPKTLLDLRAVTKGRPVYWVDPATYAVLMSPVKRLPREAPFPGTQKDIVQLGVRREGPLRITWKGMSHTIVTGMTGMGKSEFLRLLAIQAIDQGSTLLVSDIDGTTLPMFKGHASVKILASTKPEARDMVKFALDECERRKRAFEKVGGFPDTLQAYNKLPGATPLPHILVILDEFSATVEGLGGPRSAFAGEAVEVAWRGRKFGIQVVFAAQEFTKETIGKIRDHVKTVVGFKAKNADCARTIGVPDSIDIPADRVGLAMTNLYGPLQTYLVSREQLIANTAVPAPSPLSEAEQALFNEAAQDSSLKVTRARVCAMLGVSDWAARTKQAEWNNAGWLEKDLNDSNAYKLTPRGLELTNHPTAPTFTNPSPTAPTGSPTTPGTHEI